MNKILLKTFLMCVIFSGISMAQDKIPLEYQHEYRCVADVNDKNGFKYGEYVIRVNEKAVELIEMEPIMVKKVESLDDESIYILLEDKRIIVLKKVGKLQMMVGWGSLKDEKASIKTLCNWK